ncbi:MAG: hypothetical protein IAF02_12010 [Anaerolineae bacterium]|nr:hypothetical protein [Anaerolineae bacterium]
MRRILIVILFVLLFSTACGQAETAMPTRAPLAEVAVTASPSPPAEAAPELNIETVPEIVEEAEPGERPLLPNLADLPIEAGLGGGLMAGDGLVAAEQPADLWGGATFSLNTTLPTEIAEATVWQQPALPLDESRATEIAARWGFSTPLYQYATPDESILDEPVGAAAAPLPAVLPEFHVFDGARSLVMTEDAAYFSDESVPFNYETPRPFAERAAAAEAALQSMGLLNFPYILADGWGHEVWVNRELEGMVTDFPEMSAGVGENGRLAFASYQPFDALTAVGTYPLISAETAWQQIQDGIDEAILFSITSGTAETLPAPAASGFKYWPRTHQNGQEVHLYTFPTVFLPVDTSLPPLIRALSYTVQTDAETKRALAEQVGVNLHFRGILDTSTNSLALAGWEPVPDLNPLIKNGTVQRQGEQVILLDQEGNGFILPDAPADLTDGSAVNVFAWAARDVGLAYPVLDWEGIDMQIAESSGEMLAMPDMLPPAASAYEQISINAAELAYYVYPEMVAGENGRSQQLYWLLPVWQFTGLADNGDVITFTVQATARDEE